MSTPLDPLDPLAASPVVHTLPPALSVEATAVPSPSSMSPNDYRDQTGSGSHNHVKGLGIHHDQNELRDSSTTVPTTHSQSLPFFAKPSPSQSFTQEFPNPASSSPGPGSSHVRSLSSTASIRSEGVEVPARSTSLRRKPVPNMISLPNQHLPSSHPFASAASMTSVSGSTASTPYSTAGRPDEELFFSPPRTGPLPPRRPKSERDTERSSSPVSSVVDLPNREEALRMREEALLAREEALREREEFLKREEALRQREDELRRREASLTARESAATPVPVGTPGSRTPGSSRRVEQRYDSVGTPTSAIPSTALDRPLPSLPDTSQVNLRRSSESVASPVTPSSDDMTHGRVGSLRSAPIANSPSQVNRPDSRASTSASSRSHKTKPKFSIDAKPTFDELAQASALYVRDEDGHMVSFGDFMHRPHSPNAPVMPGDIPIGMENEYLPPITKTVVFFIRSFWCGQCQDFTMASLSQIDPVEVRKEGVRVVVISNGNYKVIKAYRTIMKCQFPLYVDGPRKLYALLG